MSDALRNHESLTRREFDRPIIQFNHAPSINDVEKFVLLLLLVFVPVELSLHNAKPDDAIVIGGAGVSIPNLVLLNKLFERRLLLIYAGTVVAIGTTVGIVFNLLLV